MKNFRLYNGSENFSDYSGYPDGVFFNNFLFTNQPLFQLIYDLPSMYIQPILYLNIFTIIQILLNMLFAYLFFSSLKVEKYISFFISLILVFSPFLYYNLGTHASLLIYWPMLLIFKLVFMDVKDFSSFKKALLVGFLLSLQFLLNNYFGFFTFLFLGLYFLIKIMFKPSLILPIIRFNLIVGTAFILISGVFLYPYINSLPDGIQEGLSVRTYEDFFYFSSRPWYYFLPSPNNPWIGDISKITVAFLQDEWGNWIAQNYFPSEHSVSFLGYTNIVFALIGFIFIFKKFKIKNNDFNLYKNLLILGFVALVVVSFSMPPYFTISEIKIYTPSVILERLFPMFRSLSRLGFLVLFVELIFVANGYTALLYFIRTKLIKIKNETAWNVTAIFLLIPIVMISLMEFYVPITIAKATSAPDVFVYMNEFTPEGSSFAVYPYNSATNSLFWLSVHNRKLVNPRDYVYRNGVSSENFTQNIQEVDGIENLKNLNINYLVFFPYAGNKYRLKEYEFFEKNSSLKQITKFMYEQPDIENKWLYIMKNLGNTKETSAVVYEILSN